MKKIYAEFKEFIMRGNVLDLAVGVIIGGAFQKIIGSLVNDIIMPIITRCPHCTSALPNEEEAADEVASE